MNTVPRQCYCVIRKYREKDGEAVKEIIQEATMETVGQWFTTAIFSEVFPKVCYLSSNFKVVYIFFFLSIFVIFKTPFWCFITYLKKKF